MLTEWVLFIFMHGYIMEVDTFRKETTCLDKKQTFERAVAQTKESNIEKIWCEKRHPKKPPVIIKND